MKTKIMNKNIAVATIGLMLTASLSGCFSNDNGSGADEPGVIYEPGLYEVELIFKETLPAGKATITAGPVMAQVNIAANKTRGHFVQMKLPAGKIKLSVDVQINGKAFGPHQVILTRK